MYILQFINEQPYHTATLQTEQEVVDYLQHYFSPNTPYYYTTSGQDENYNKGVLDYRLRRFVGALMVKLKTNDFILFAGDVLITNTKKI